MKSKPTTEITPCDARGSCDDDLSTCSATAWVRLTEAPSGSASAAKNAPWSSLRQEALRRELEQRRRSPTTTRPARPGRRPRPAPAARTIADIAVARPVDARRAHSASARGSRAAPRFSSTAQSAGLRVSALIAEISIETDTATANWRNSWPLMPGMKATGTNTESSTSVIAMIGAVISPIAFLVASWTESSGSSSITRSTFSMTTIASSTTMPIASTSASSDTVLAR